jgi:hypothetical protein
MVVAVRLLALHRRFQEPGTGRASQKTGLLFGSCQRTELDVAVRCNSLRLAWTGLLARLLLVLLERAWWFQS